jgi:RES domain-containing protein
LMTVYRMHRSARAAKDYTGAMLAGGRWNPIGTPMLYAARHLSLACIEVLVHLDKGQLPRDHVWSKAELSSPLGLLSFNDLNEIASCQLAGDRWVRASGELAIQVPSVVIPEEFNILLNARHTDYDALRWSDARPFRFDPPLFVAEPYTL